MLFFVTLGDLCAAEDRGFVLLDGAIGAVSTNKE